MPACSLNMKWGKQPNKDDEQREKIKQSNGLPLLPANLIITGKMQKANS